MGRASHLRFAGPETVAEGFQGFRLRRDEKVTAFGHGLAVHGASVVLEQAVVGHCRGDRAALFDASVKALIAIREGVSKVDEPIREARRLASVADPSSTQNSLQVCANTFVVIPS